MKRYALYMATRNLYQALVPAIYSLVSHTRVDKVFVLIEDARLPRELPAKNVEIINVGGQQIFSPGGPNYKSHWTYMVLLRAALSELLPDYVDLVLSLDTDTFVMRDISDLWEMPMGDYYMAMALDVPEKQLPKRPYYNAGVCLHNLVKQRDGASEKAVKLLNEKKFEFPEQDVFNAVCKDKILELPREYNVMPFAFDAVKNPKILHYAGIRNYADYLIVQGYRDRALDAIAKGMRL